MNKLASRENNKNDLLALFIVSILVFLTFSNSGLFISRVMLYIVFLFTILFIPIIKRKFLLTQSTVLKSALMLIIYNVLMILFNYENTTSIYNGVLYSATILFFLVLISTRIEISFVKLLIKHMSKFGKMLIFIYFITNLLSLSIHWVSGVSFLFFFLYYIYVDNETRVFSKVLYTILWLVIALFNGERTFILVFGFFLITIILWKWITKNQIIYNLFFIVIILLCFVIPLIYIYLSQSEYAQILNTYAIEYTNSRFFSGRNIIWLAMMNYFQDGNILLGRGHHVTPYFLYGVNISSHNTYVSILVTTGILGCLFFFMFIRSIWSKFYAYKDIPIVRMSAIFFITSLLKQSSELSLFSNNISLSIFTWLVISFGLMHVNATLTKKEDENVYR